jgi:prepilin signal peptidase PulO-like enzyme (type II secretory pathway)
MRQTWFPMLAMALGLALGPALAAYARWMIRIRRLEQAGGFSPETVMAASAANGLGWLAASLLGASAVDTANMGLMVSAGVALTLIDVKIRIIPNELAAALLALSAVLAVLVRGPAALPGRVVGLLVALTLFLVAMLIAGPGKVGGGDVKLAAAVGFAAGFPNVLMAVLLMAVLSALAGAAGILARRMGKKTPMPFAGFLMAGLALTLLLDRLGALTFLAWG